MQTYSGLSKLDLYRIKLDKFTFATNIVHY